MVEPTRSQPLVKFSFPLFLGLLTKKVLSCISNQSILTNKHQRPFQARLLCRFKGNTVQQVTNVTSLKLKIQTLLVKSAEVFLSLPLTVKCHVDVNQSIPTETIVNITEASEGQNFGARPFSELHTVGLALICLWFNFGRENNLGSPGRVTGLCCGMGVGGVYTQCFVFCAQCLC